MEQNIVPAMLLGMFACHGREIEDGRDRYYWVCNAIRNYESGKQELFTVTIEELRSEREQLKQKFGF